MHGVRYNDSTGDKQIGRYVVMDKFITLVFFLMLVALVVMGYLLA